MNIAKMTMTEIRELIYENKATGTEILNALLVEMRERKTKTSSRKVIRFINYLPLAQGLTDEDIVLFEKIRTS